MLLSPADAEYLADQLFDDAGASRSVCTPTPLLARALLGPGAIQIVPRHALRSLGALARVGHSWRVYVQAGAPRALLGHIVGHELAHWVARRDRFELDEEDCDWVGAALVFPRRVVQPDLLETLPATAAGAHTTQSLVALRVGEALELPLALVAPHRVRIRGPEQWVWPAEDVVRSWSRRPAPELRRVTLPAERERVVLVARDT